MTPALTTQTAHPLTNPCSPSQRERTKDRRLGGQAQGPGPGLCCLPACLAPVHLRVRHAKARTPRLTLQTPRRPLGPASLTLPGPPRLKPCTNPVGQRGPSEPSPPVGFLHPAWGLWPRPLASLPRLGVQPVSPGRWQPARLGCWFQAKPRVCRVISRGKGGVALPASPLRPLGLGGPLPGVTAACVSFQGISRTASAALQEWALQTSLVVSTFLPPVPGSGPRPGRAPPPGRPLRGTGGRAVGGAVQPLGVPPRGGPDLGGTRLPQDHRAHQ